MGLPMASGSMASQPMPSTAASRCRPLSASGKGRTQDPSAWRDFHAGQHVVIGIPLLVPRALGLLIDAEPGTGDPRSDLPHARVVMVVAVGAPPRRPRPPPPEDLAGGPPGWPPAPHRLERARPSDISIHQRSSLIGGRYALGMDLPADYEVRASAQDDLDAVAGVLVAGDLHDTGQSVLDADFLQDQWSRAGFDLATDDWVVVDRGD